MGAPRLAGPGNSDDGAYTASFVHPLVKRGRRRTLGPGVELRNEWNKK